MAVDKNIKVCGEMTPQQFNDLRGMIESATRLLHDSLCSDRELLRRLHNSENNEQKREELSLDRLTENIKLSRRVKELEEEVLNLKARLYDISSHGG